METKLKLELLSITPDAEKLIEKAGRCCYKSEVGNPSIIKAWIKSGHESVIEHATATFRINGVSRALTHQLVRHRLASYSQQSQRYVDENDFDYVIPEEIKKNEDALKIFERTMKSLELTYRTFLNLGIKKEDARAILPNATSTEIVMSMNFRELRSFLILRTEKHAQQEIRNLANEILKIMKKQASNCFGDIKI